MMTIVMMIVMMIVMVIVIIMMIMKGQRLVMPGVQRLIVVSSADGRRMVAVRPMMSANTITNTISTAK